MRGASIHIQAADTAGIISHDSRQKEHIANSIFSRENNEYLHSATEAMRIYQTELEKRTKAYMERTHQKLQKKTKTLLEAVVVLEKHHTLSDVMKVAKYLEKQYDSKIVQVAIHKDEGHIEAGKPVINYHAHILFMGIDSQGKSITRRLMKLSQLRKLQDINARLLNMRRGTDARKSKIKHLSTDEYKEVMHRLYEEKQKTIQNYKKQHNWFENYQRYFDHYNQIVQQFKTGQISKQQAIDMVQDISGMFSRQDWEDLPIRKAKQMATLGLLAAYHVQGNQKGENAVVREIDRGKEMTTEALEEAISMILSFTHKNLQQEVERDA